MYQQLKFGVAKGHKLNKLDKDICAQDKAKRTQAQLPRCLNFMESFRQELPATICGNRHSMLTLKKMNLGLSVQNFNLFHLYTCD